MKSSTCRESFGSAVLNFFTGFVKMLVDRERADREREIRELQWRVDILHKSICQHDALIIELSSAVQERRGRRAA